MAEYEFTITHRRCDGDWVFYFNDSDGLQCLFEAFGHGKHNNRTKMISDMDTGGPAVFYSKKFVLRGYLSSKRGWTYQVSRADYGLGTKTTDKLKRKLNHYVRWLEKAHEG